MSRQYASQLLFEVSYSQQYFYCVIVGVILSLMAIFLIDNHIFQFILLVGLSAMSFLSLRNNRSRELQWQPDGGWLIMDEKTQQMATLQPGSVVLYFFAALNFKMENNKKINVILFSDNINAEKFRQLRVRLKVEPTNIS